MPRLPRIDAPGCIHHVMARGIDGRDIFQDDRDRSCYLDLLARFVAEHGAGLLAWALMPNHVHLVLETGHRPLWRTMHRLGTAYGRRFNGRHGRRGYVFQDRYRAILVDRESYLLSVVRYVHRNPLRAGLVRDLRALEGYPWTGHAVLMSRREASFQSTRPILERFGPDPEQARRALRAWMDMEPDPAPVAGPDLDALIARVCRALDVDPDAVRAGRRERAVCEARAAVARLARHHFSQRALALRLGVSPQALTHASRRGRKVIEKFAIEPGLY